MPTLSEIDEALMHASLVPENERGPAWHSYTNALLEKRANHKNETHTHAAP